jgi:hypothetical protein
VITYEIRRAKMANFMVVVMRVLMMMISKVTMVWKMKKRVSDGSAAKDLLVYVAVGTCFYASQRERYTLNLQREPTPQKREKPEPYGRVIKILKFSKVRSRDSSFKSLASHHLLFLFLRRKQFVRTDNQKFGR